MKVNFLDLKKQYLSIKEDIDKAIADVFEQTAFAGGPFVEKFEENFARAHQAKHCIAVNNGTSALHALLMALEIGPRDEVIVPANTFFATPQSVSLAGATPIFVDCEEAYYNLDPTKVEAAITSKTKAIFAVHLYGQPAAMDELKAIADKHNLLLLEDCAQAHLAQYHGQFVGTIGKAGCFSFYPGKNLGAYGEGGAILTNDNALAARLKKLRNHGSEIKYQHEFVGHNYRMSGLQGAILDVKLKHLSDWTDKRIENARRYKENLEGLTSIVLPAQAENLKHVYHLYIIQTKEREKLTNFLQENGIYTGLHYPIPCHLQEAYNSLDYRDGDFPVGERLSKRILSLPMSEQLTTEEVDYVCDKIKEFYREN